jgi:catechol 2,3-dioxygenase-like lactoylglutathione lyase family enzyme
MTNFIQHVNVMVDDIDAADVFYAGVLGFDRSPTPELGFPAQFYAVGGGQEIHVNELGDVHPERSHFCLRLDNFDDVFARALEAGIIDTDTWGKARRLPTGVMQVFVRDPAGNLIELACDADQPIDESIFDLDIFE